MLFAEGDGTLPGAGAARTGWRARSVGFVGASDGWQDAAPHGRARPTYGRAADGNVALTGELILAAGR